MHKIITGERNNVQISTCSKQFTGRNLLSSKRNINEKFTFGANIICFNLHTQTFLLFLHYLLFHIQTLNEFTPSLFIIAISCSFLHFLFILLISDTNFFVCFGGLPLFCVVMWVSEKGFSAYAISRWTQCVYNPPLDLMKYLLVFFHKLHIVILSYHFFSIYSVES